MAWVDKKYTLYKSENFEEYMKALGVGFFLRKIGNNVTPTVFLVKKGDWYEFHTESTFKTTILKFKLGEEFEEETMDGRVVKTTMTLDGNTLNQVQKTDKKSTIVREFTETECKVICTYGDVVSTRWYKV
ncbi:probable fatty acid-binding protein [Chironomus tepperi]|uniref:probable fatty acid-binding protein n=1 Tax=Chironomus tepperi TaxID=113505 RepID=UPI00391F66E3